MPYYDVFIAPVADSKRSDYEDFLKRSHAQLLGYGATEVVDLWAEDVPGGKLSSLPLSVKLKEGESVTVGVVIWPSKETREAGWKKMMEEDADIEMPFDGKRMIFGGFNELLITRA